VKQRVVNGQQPMHFNECSGKKRAEEISIHWR